jgi:hypothetical protein
MRSMPRLPVLIAVVLALFPLTGRAQTVTGLPVINSRIATGLTLAGEVGFPDNDYGQGTAYGARASLGLGVFGIMAMVSTWNPDLPGEDSRVAYGGSLNYKLLGGPLTPLSVTLQGGVEAANAANVDQLHFPIGLGVALTIPNPALAIRPWLAPRLDITRLSGGTTDQTESNFGISGGVEFGLLGGLGFGVSYDRVFAGNGFDPSVWSAGLNYTIKVPGL